MCIRDRQLRKEGYQITVYDRYDRPGGLLIYGIPNFKLEKFVVERRTKLLEESGIKFVHNFEVGKDATLDELREKHDAILIATGVYKARDITTPGSGLDGIVPALEYLTASNKKSLGDKVEAFDDGTLNAENKDIVVIGGGDTAMDCVRTAIRQKARSVSCLYRRDRVNMPGSQREVQNAEEEGVVFKWLSAPQAFIGDVKVGTVQAQRIHLGQPDATGRQVPEVIEGSTHELHADMVIKAWPAIKDDRDSVSIKLMDNPLAADAMSQRGQLRLALLKGREQTKYLSKNLLKGTDLDLSLIHI